MYVHSDVSSYAWLIIRHNKLAENNSQNEILFHQYKVSDTKKV